MEIILIIVIRIMDIIILFELLVGSIFVEIKKIVFILMVIKIGKKKVIY